jgi:site-specific recombinase XerD
MSQDLVPVTTQRKSVRAGLRIVPVLFAEAGERATERFIEFFAANIRNPHTRIAYAHAVQRFSDWCQPKRVGLNELKPVHIGAYVEELGKRKEEGGAGLAKPTVKQHLAAFRMLFDWLVIGQIVSSNPATSVRGPKHVITKGRTPVLTEDEARSLFERLGAVMEEADKRLVELPHDATAKQRRLLALRDRALIGVMVYSFARIGAVLGMNVEDYYQRGKRWWIRLHEKGGKHHEVPAHHKLEEYLDPYLAEAGIADRKGGPLFRSLNRQRQLSLRRLAAREALAMIKRRAKAADLGEAICCHTFRATGITNYLEHQGTLEKAQQIAAHSSPRTTKLYDRTNDQVDLGEIEKIQI